MLAIIGGTGLAALDALEVTHVSRPATPFGLPSSDIVHGRLANQDVLFLSRHGAQHQFLPHEVNYRANIFALKALGATQIVGVSAVGSLSEPIEPGQLAIPSQYFDWTRGRRAPTFFGDGIAVHVSTANPVSDNLVQWIARHAAALDMALHTGVTYACVEGPRLGTRAESHFLRQAGCHLVGMTNVPEVFLAREAQICYATIGIATDYDCWMDDPAKHVQATEIFGLYRSSLARVQRLLQAMLADQRPAEEADIRGALAYAMLTPDSALSDEQRTWMSVLRR
ncbi:MTAP family purine nucleoside phosphorylase [Massilia sp. H6]|uniref:MTAP family purine nucleoside phosphorylase n=1 Tax=Massilia sp. H6 TaxID=2970464 RepID=UPI002168318E|nr:MTAP family purine nucleoside phosphorylase [Massilia sp. H6]UVW30049.1 MTAP family purine nucleoside phosphorylase [Massilia sp. H6]